MSLLNDMLRDLAAQQHTPTAPRPLIETLSDGAELSHGDSPMGFMHAQWVWSLLIFLVLVGAVLIFKYTRLAGDVVENPRAQVVAPQKASVVFTPTTVDSTPVVNLGAPKKTEIKSSQNTLEIVKLLVMAQRAFDRDRLTSPIEDNAYSYYQRILDSDKNNRLALEGVSAIAERYLAMTGLGMMEIDEEWPENKIKRAELYINRAESVSPKSSLLAEYKNKLALIVSEQRVRSESSYNSVGAGQVDESLPSVNALSGDSPVASMAIKEPFINLDGAAELRITSNASWQDKTQSEKAREFWLQGEPNKAEALLLSTLTQMAAAPSSVSLLLELYSQQNNIEGYSRTMLRVEELSLDEQYYFKAKLALMRNDKNNAIALLEEKLNIASANENYCALLAALYQQVGRHKNSAVSYRRLLDVFGNKSSYWLGLALSLDALSKPVESLRAFKQLSQYTDIQPPVRHYVEQRIQQLEPY